ncbi:MAG: hypothetical protein IPM64_05560 [Phycisphaerales bacterium]|nr:hypothetical protein [Phycisphaerales bacterium]
MYDAIVLTRFRLVQMRNALDQQLREAPLRTLVTIGLLVLIWAALYFLLSTVFRSVDRWGVVSIVVSQLIFVHFFVVLSVMLCFSNAILGFGALYGRSEAALLLGTPVHARQIVLVKWVEGMILSSWSFLLLGVPLMLAVAELGRVDWTFYGLFVVHFVFFVAIPSNVGMLAAWVVAMWAPRRPGAMALWAAVIGFVLAVAWMARVVRGQSDSAEWLHTLLAQSAVVAQDWLPSTWTAKGIIAATERRLHDSVFWLLVVMGNAAFLSWLTVNLLAASWPEAYSRAQEGRHTPLIRRGWVTEIVCWTLFFYLPRRIRMLMLKDLRGFARDPRQWTQMAIMLGLLIIYVLNLQRLPVDVSYPQMRGLVAFLNLTTIALILATFTSRFVYPLLSLESQQLWLLGLLPTGRLSLLLAKFLFAITVTGLSGVIVMGLAVSVLEMPAVWARANLAICAATCVGLCGLAVGLGARYPVLGQRNPARIASGVGGTFNLIASMLFVLVQLAGAAWLSFSELRSNSAMPDTLSSASMTILVWLVAFGGVVAAGALWVGWRHFERLEA